MEHQVAACDAKHEPLLQLVLVLLNMGPLLLLLLLRRRRRRRRCRRQQELECCNGGGGRVASAKHCWRYSSVGCIFNSQRVVLLLLRNQ
jgi:hypothetical protein